MRKTRPKTTRPIPSGPRDLAGQLRDAIAERGVTSYELGKAAQVDPGQITRFMAEERDITLATAGRLATALGLRLVEKAARVGRPSTKTAKPLGDAAE